MRVAQHSSENGGTPPTVTLVLASTSSTVHLIFKPSPPIGGCPSSDKPAKCDDDSYCSPGNFCNKDKVCQKGKCLRQARRPHTVPLFLRQWLRFKIDFNDTYTESFFSCSLAIDDRQTVCWSVCLSSWSAHSERFIPLLPCGCVGGLHN